MPILHSPRQERFARYFLESGNAAASYLKAGYKAASRTSLDSAASRLSRSFKVQGRIRELQGQMITRNRVTVDSLLEDLRADRELARGLGQPSAAIQATQLAARLTGLLVDRKETGGPGDFASLQSVDEVLAVVRKELGDEAASLLAATLTKQAETDGALSETLPDIETEPNASIN